MNWRSSKTEQFANKSRVVRSAFILSSAVLLDLICWLQWLHWSSWRQIWQKTFRDPAVRRTPTGSISVNMIVRRQARFWFLKKRRHINGLVSLRNSAVSMGACRKYFSWSKASLRTFFIAFLPQYFFTARCYAQRSYATVCRLSIRLSVRASVREIQVPRSHQIRSCLYFWFLRFFISVAYTPLNKMFAVFFINILL